MKADIYWIAFDAPGRLGIMARPRGGDWLDDELRALTLAGVSTLVCALTSAELVELELERLESATEVAGLTFIAAPIRDRGVPASFELTLHVAREAQRVLARGEGIVFHCRAGIGRASLLAACALVGAGQTPGVAFARIRQARGVDVPVTGEQREWLDSFAAWYARDA